MSGNSFAGIDEILSFPQQGLRRNISHITQTWSRLKKLHQTKTDHIESSTLIFLLPFSSNINNCICRTLQDRHGHVNWRFSLASVTLLVSGSITDKLNFIHQLYEKEATTSTRTLIKDVLRSAQRIAISLNVEVYANKKSSKCNIGSSRYHGEDSLDLLVDNLLSNYAENEAAHDLQKPLRFTWTSHAPNSSSSMPCSRSKHAACLNGHKIYLLGGRDGRYTVNDFWSYDLMTECWSKLVVSGDSPPSLEDHTMVSYGHKIFVFGGVCRMSVDGETPFWIFDTLTNRWRQWKSESDVMLPPCLKGHTAVLVEKNIYIFGGYEDILGSTELMWSFDVVDEQWHLAYSQSLKGIGPAPRHHHTATLHNGTMLVIGGVNNLNPVTDMWSWNFKTQCWTKIKSASNIPIIYNHTAIKLASSIFIYGGQNQLELSKSVWEYKIDTSLWKCKEAGVSQAPPTRTHHVALLIPPTAYAAPPATERTRSVPVIRSTTRELSHRPKTAPSQSSNTHFITSNRVYPLIVHRDVLQSENTRKVKRCFERSQSTFDNNNNSSATHNHDSSQVYHCNKKSMHQSKSDNGVVSYFHSDSSDPLIECSRTYSDNSFTFDNPAYMNSYDELSARININIPTLPYTHRRSTGYGKLSRSLDSIQDVVHDGTANYAGSVATLPGTVLSHSEETINGTCTVRNIILDEQMWDESWEDEEIVDIPDTQSQDPTQPVPYKLYIIGGQERTNASTLAQNLVMWRANITGKGYSKSSKHHDGCMIS